MSNTNTVRRQGQFKTGLDSSGVRRTKIGDTQKTHTPLSSFVAEIVLPDDFTSREVPANSDRAAIPYREYRIKVGGGYVLINDMRKEAPLTALISIKEKSVKKGSQTFTVPYLKLEDTDDAATHRIEIASDKQAIDNAVTNRVEGQMFFDLAVFGHNMAGGIIVTPIA